MGLASTESLLYEAAILVELGPRHFVVLPVRGVGASVWRQVDHLALSGRDFFLVAVPDLGKRRKPHPAGCMSSVALILREDTWINVYPHPP